MAPKYFIVPYEPMKIEEGNYFSTLQIEVEHFKGELTKRWPTIEFDTPIEGISLAWIIWYNNRRSFFRGLLYSDQQVVSFNLDDLIMTSFILWYRNYVTDEIQLFLFDDYGYPKEYLELRITTTEQELRKFLFASD